MHSESFINKKNSKYMAYAKLIYFSAAVTGCRYIPIKQHLCKK